MAGPLNSICASYRRIERDLRSTKGSGAPEFRFPHPVPLEDRSMTAARQAGSRYYRAMKRDVAEFFKDALALPPRPRAALAGSLLDSLGTESTVTERDRSGSISTRTQSGD
jgi:hypothetical protein